MIRKKRKPQPISQSDLRLNLQPMLKARGIEKAFTFLLKAGISSGSIKRILNGTTSQINIQNLTNLCTQLRCTPNDLFSIEDPNVDVDHPLQKLAETQPDLDIKHWLKNASIEEIIRIKNLAEKKL